MKSLLLCLHKLNQKPHLLFRSNNCINTIRSKMSKISEEYIASVISKVAIQNNLKECQYSRVTFESIAQNYFGVLVPVVLNAKKDNKDVKVDAVLKLAPTDERYRVSGAVTHFFLREIYVYSIILDKYHILQQHFPQPLQYLIPKCYYVCKDFCNEAIVMQNMSADGFKPYTNEMFLDLDHITVSIESLAKFHALSFITREKDPKLYEEAIGVCLPLTESNNKRYMDILKDRLEKALQKLEDTKYIPILENFKENYVKLIESASNLVQKTCICHGDIWKENILFKYEDNKPISACLIDYQTARTISPAFDILYLITSSTNKQLRHKHYKKLLTLYHQTFSTVLKKVGLESEELYSWDMFETDLEVVSPACFIVANTALWLSNGLQKEGHVRSKNAWNTEEEEKEAVNRYKSVITGIIDDYVEYGYLTL